MIFLSSVYNHHHEGQETSVIVCTFINKCIEFVHGKCNQGYFWRPDKELKMWHDFEISGFSFILDPVYRDNYFFPQKENDNLCNSIKLKLLLLPVKWEMRYCTMPHC